MTCFRADASPRAQPLYRYRQKVRPTKSNPPHLFFPYQTNGMPSLMGFGSNTQQHDKFKSVLVHSARRYGRICGRHVLETRTRNHNGELQIAEIRRSVPVGQGAGHHLAELLERAETATGEEKSITRRDCSDLILKLWAHRASLPPNRRPLQSFDSILTALKHLRGDEPVLLPLAGAGERKESLEPG